jgi:hypothetical protein
MSLILNIGIHIFQIFRYFFFCILMEIIKLPYALCTSLSNARCILKSPSRMQQSFAVPPTHLKDLRSLDVIEIELFLYSLTIEKQEISHYSRKSS